MEGIDPAPFTCVWHGLPLDDTWQCPDHSCRASHCPYCGAYEKNRCGHLLYTDGEWVYYAPGGMSSEDFPGGGFEDFELEELIEAFDGDEEMARRLAAGEDPLRTLCEMAVERLEGPFLVSSAGGWSPGSDSWSNTWVENPAEALFRLAPLLQRYLAGVELLEDEFEDDGDE